MRSDWLIQVSYAVRYNNFLPPSATFWNCTGPIGFIHTGEKKEKRKKEKLLHNLQISIRSELATVLSFATWLAIVWFRSRADAYRCTFSRFSLVLILYHFNRKMHMVVLKDIRLNDAGQLFSFCFFSPLALHKSTSSSSSHQMAKRTSNSV